MATFDKLTLSGSTDGRPILVAATATPGTTIHTASSTATVYDEVWLYATNNDGSSISLSIEFGGTTSPNDIIKLSVPAQSGLFLLVPGLVLKGNATPLVIKAFAATANKISISGWVNRIS